MIRRPKNRILIQALLTLLLLCPVTAEDVEAESGFVWHGKSNSHGGKVRFSSPPEGDEYHESKKIDITCYAFDRGIRLILYSDTPEDFEAGQGVVFSIDGGERFGREAEIAYWGYFGKMPSTWLSPEDLELLMKGSNLKITLEHDVSGFVFNADLTATHRLFSRHLRACLT